MKLKTSLLIGNLIHLGLLNAESITLTEANFDSTLKEYDDILVNFYSPWAVNWKSLQPHFEAAAPVLDASYPPYLVAKVNCNEEKVLCYKYTDSSGYPDPVFLNFKHRNAEEIEAAKAENVVIEEEFAKSETESAEQEIEADENEEKNEDEKEEKPEEKEEKEEKEENDEEKQKIAAAKRFKKMKLLDEKYIITDYKGGKTGPGIYRSLIQGRENLNEVQDIAHFNKLMKAQVPIVIGFFDPEKSENKNKAPGFKAFSMAADQLNDFQQEKIFHVSKVRSYYTFSKEIAEKANAKIGTLIYYRPENDTEDFQERTEVYDKNGKFTKGLIRSFIRDNAMGLALAIRPDEKETIGYPLVLTIFDVEPKKYAKDSDEDFAKKVEISKKARNIVRKASRDLAKKYSVNFALGDRMQFRDLMYDFKIKAHDSEFDDKFPFTVVFEDEWSKYVMTETFSEENYRDFLHKHERREIKMYVKSEEDPVNSPEEPITILTANNFDEYVNSGSDLFIKFYAPWCGHCRRLAPYYEKMADMLLPSKPDLLISKMDIDANDLPPGFEVQGVPTMYFIPKGGKPEKYVGSREPLEMIKWLEEHATVKPKMKSVSELNIDADVMAEARKRAEEAANEAMEEAEEENDADIVDADTANETENAKDEL